MTSKFFQGGQQAFLKTWASLLLMVASLAGNGSGWATETQATAEHRERAVFIEKAMEEHSARVIEVMQEMYKSGIHPYLRVTVLMPFADWDYYVVAGGEITWAPNSGQKYEAVVVPEGFVTDLASIPKLFWQIMRPEGRHAYAAVVHDTCTGRRREQEKRQI